MGALTAGRDFQSRRRARRAHHRTGRVDDRTPPTWDWSFETDGALALDRADAWEVPTSADPSGHTPNGRGAGRVERACQLRYGPADAVAPSPQADGSHAGQRRARQHRIRRIVGLLALAAVLLVTLVLTAFGTGQSRAPRATTAPAHRLLPAGPPRPQVVAMQGVAAAPLPVPQERLSAIGYHAPATARCRSSRSASRRTRDSSRGSSTGSSAGTAGSSATTSSTAVSARPPAASTSALPRARTCTRRSTARSSASATTSSTASGTAPGSTSSRLRLRR